MSNMTGRRKAARHRSEHGPRSLVTPPLMRDASASALVSSSRSRHNRADAARTHEIKSGAFGTIVGTIITRLRGLAVLLARAVTAHVIWNRVATRDDSDSAIVMVGAGYRF